MENSKGKQMAVFIGAWLVVKGVINLLLGFGIGNLLTLVVSAVLAGLLVLGAPYLNYVTAVLMAIVVLVNLPGNISGLHIFYLLEAVVDVVAIIILVTNADVKKHFTSEGE